MKLRFSRGQWGLFCAGVLTLAAALAPSACAQAIQQGLALCLELLVPALFPFFLLGSLLARLGVPARLGRLLEPVMRRVFRLPGAAAAPLALGLLGGYPTGARAVRTVQEQGLLTPSESERLLSFCNNCGPAFFLGVVGPLFGSAGIGAILYAIHAGTALLTGVLLRSRRVSAEPSSIRSESVAVSTPFLPSLTGAALDALRALAPVFAAVLLFTLLTALMDHYGLLTLLCQPLAPMLGLEGARATLSGLLEISSGIPAVASSPLPAGTALCLCAGLLGFGGLSVHCQTLGVLQGSGLSCRRHLMGKLMQGILSILFCRLLLPVVPLSVPTVLLPEPVPWHLLPEEMVLPMVTASIKLCLGMAILLLLPIFVLFVKKRWKKPKRRHIMKL